MAKSPPAWTWMFAITCVPSAVDSNLSEPCLMGLEPLMVWRVYFLVGSYSVTSLVEEDSMPMNVHTSVMRVPTPTGSSGCCWMLCRPAVDCHWVLFLASVTKANTSSIGH